MLQHSGARLAELATCYNSLERHGCAGLADPWANVCGRAGLAAALHALAFQLHRPNRTAEASSFLNFMVGHQQVLLQTTSAASG
jgi:hypothetical protein